MRKRITIYKSTRNIFCLLVTVGYRSDWLFAVRRKVIVETGTCTTNRQIRGLGLRGITFRRKERRRQRNTSSVGKSEAVDNPQTEWRAGEKFEKMLAAGTGHRRDKYDSG